MMNGKLKLVYVLPGSPTTIKTMDVNMTTIAYLRVSIIGIGSTIILMVVEAQGSKKNNKNIHWIMIFAERIPLTHQLQHQNTYASTGVMQ